MSEPKDADLRLWNFEFGLEVSTRYHDWRRATLGAYVNIVRLVSLAGAVLALVLLHGGADIAPIAIANASIAMVVLFDLVFGFDANARKHTDLYQRFKSVQEKVARHGREWADYLPEWDAEVQRIRADEPPVFWGLYATSWNQTVERREVQEGYRRKIGWFHYLLRYFWQFRPEDFPLDAAVKRA
jgi:hypothetical protein